jgi:hypothetical protein
VLLSLTDSLSWWTEVARTDKGFDWIPRTEPYTISCELSELPEAQTVFNSYITLSDLDDPTMAGTLFFFAICCFVPVGAEQCFSFFWVADFPVIGLVNIFFLDFREEGLVKYVPRIDDENDSCHM